MAAAVDGGGNRRAKLIQLKLSFPWHCSLLIETRNEHCILIGAEELGTRLEGTQ